jgi:hypothetical protein
MKKVFVFLGALLIAGPCFAQTPQPKPLAMPVKAQEEKTTAGQVSAVTLADAAKGTKSEIVLTGEKPESFLVKETTTIYDLDGKAITLDKIAKDNNVQIKYVVSPEGINEALSINLVKPTAGAGPVPAPAAAPAVPAQPPQK